MIQNYRPDLIKESHQTSVILEINSVIKNTYILLACTLVFSALTAGFAMITNASPMPPLLLIGIYFAMLYAVTLLQNSGWGIVAVFALTGFLGYTLGPILNFYQLTYTNGNQLIMSSLGLTGIVFFGLSGYALTTRSKFNYLGGFLFVGITTVFLASLANLFLQIPIMSLVISCAVVLLMSGYILYETSAIIHGGQRNYIMATLSLYISIFNLFVSLLQILAAFSGRRD